MEYAKLLSECEYADLRIGKWLGSTVKISDDEIKQSAGSIKGIGIRVFENGSWGFASGDADSDIKKLLEAAKKLAKMGSGKIRIKEPKPIKKRITDKVKTTDVEEQIGSLIEFSKKMKDEKVVSRQISCSDAVVTDEFYSSSGSEITQTIGFTYLSCTCIGKGANLQRASERTWSRSGFSDIDFDVADKSREKVLRLLKASAPPSGRFTVILDPEMTGVFSHEAIGHACEADAVVDKESILEGKIGASIGNELVSIVDDPGANDFGRFVFDDEGVEGEKTTLIENGVLKNYINSMESARELNHELNGHARAESYDSTPVVRMSNTYFQKGKSKVDDVFDVKDGIYLKGMKGGSVDIFSGAFMFKAEEAYEINNGSKGKMMRDVTISGSILQTMKDVECVGNDFGTSPGMCGKSGQSVPVSDGGPHIRVKNVAIG